MAEIPKEVKTKAIPNRSWCPLDNGTVRTDHRTMSKRAGVAIAYNSPQNVMLLLNCELFCSPALPSQISFPRLRLAAVGRTHSNAK
jgi:hypothetical protein